MAKKKKEEKRGIMINPKNIPSDVRAIILNKQAEQRIDCKCHYSQERAVYELIRSTKKS